MIKLYLLDNEILTFIHPHRTSIFEEADECKRLHKDKIEIINKQIEKYKKDGYTDKSHLVMTNMLFRYNTDSVNRFNEMWWEQINNYSKRDQISFNYVLWKLNMMCDTCDLNAFNNPYFKYSQHNRKQRV